jgi:hypothetical protein
MSTEEFQVWVTLALERQDLSILADWLKEQPSSTIHPPVCCHFP